MSNFEKATRVKLRFDLSGHITTEDLWDFQKEELADYEVRLQERIEKQGKSNRFAKKKTTAATDELRLAIVSYIIDVKVAEEEESANATIKKQERERLLSYLAKIQESKLDKLSEEEILAKLAEL